MRISLKAFSSLPPPKASSFPARQFISLPLFFPPSTFLQGKEIVNHFNTSPFSQLLLSPLINHGNCIRNSEENWCFRSRVGLPQVHQGQGGTSCQKRQETRPRRPKKNYSLPQSGTGSHLGVLILLLQTPL